MPLLIDELAKQVLEQTRIVSNGPVLAADEALRVDVIPGGGAGAQPANEALSLALGATNPLAALHIDVTYELRRDGKKLTERTAAVTTGEYLQVPTVTSGTTTTAQGLLSVAFLVAPKVRLVKAGSPPQIRAGLPVLDHALVVRITVSSPRLQDPPPTREVEIPFTVATIEVPLPMPPAVCICASDADLNGEKYLIMLPPGSPSSVSQIVQVYNTVLDGLKALESVLLLISSVLKPLELVVSTLAKVPTPYVTTGARVQDFDDFNDFDDEMSSVLIVGPTGVGVKFSDTANPGDWDDLGDNSMRSYRVIDLLQLPSHPQYGSYLLGKLGMDGAKVGELAVQVGSLTGVPPADARLGIGVFYVHNLAGADTPGDLKRYDEGDTDEPVQDDTESAMWITG